MSDLRSRITPPDGQAFQDRAWAQHGWLPLDARPWQRVFSLPPGHDGVLDDSLWDSEVAQAEDCALWRNAGYQPKEAARWDRAVGPNPQVADEWKAAGVSPAQTRAWLTVVGKGLLAGQARLAGETEADLARRLASTGLPGEMVDLALSNGFTLDEIKDFRDPEQWEAVESVVALGRSGHSDDEDEQDR